MTAPARLEVADVRLAFGRGPSAVEVLRGVDLRAAAGEVVALVGPNGAGKTSLLRVVLGRLVPTGGVVRVEGEDPGNPATRRRLGWVPERAEWPAGLAASEVLSLHGRLQGLARSEARAAIAAVVERFGLAGWADRRVEHLSFGQRRRLALAAATLHRPDLLVLDEASTGLDPAGQEAFATVVRAEAGRGCAVLLCTHDLDEVVTLAGRVVVLAAGRVVAEGAPPEVLPGADNAARREALRRCILAGGCRAPEPGRQGGNS